MPFTTRLVGLILMLIGIGTYLLTGRTSVTALIPAFFGVVFVGLAYVARNEAARRHAMHAAVALALIGVLGTLGRAIPAVAAGQLMRPAVLAQLVTAVVLGIYVWMGVRSFIAAQRARQA
ncbi:MAG TPA: hypothetical protein PLH72_07465 [Vicinamibacterales bacterium]|jgi:hypothetical protein|nr:hypothetical protein [Vicinamibacterales bacterium]